MTTMRGKPIVEIEHRGKRVRIDFASQQKGVTIRYDVIVDGEPVLSAVFAEEVMRWLADAIHEEAKAAASCSMEDAYRCRDAQNVDCQFPHCQIREDDNVSLS
jgi:hypothetical protein